MAGVRIRVCVVVGITVGIECGFRFGGLWVEEQTNKKYIDRLQTHRNHCPKLALNRVVVQNIKNP